MTNKDAAIKDTASLGHHKRRQSLAITADAQFPVDRGVLGRSCSQIFLNPPRYILGLGLPVTDRRLSDVRRLPAVTTCSPRGLRTGACWFIRVVRGERSTAHGELCTNGISHCDSTHGHHPCLLSFAFNVRPSHEFPCMRGTRGRAPCAKGGMRRGVRSLNDA